MADLFQRIDDRREEWEVEVRVTFLEIYNEEIRDLLAEPGLHIPRGGLSIREDKSVKVVGLVELKPQSAEEVKEIVLQGNLRRTQSPTHANETSSRSHAVLQVHVLQAPRTAALTEQRTMATLSIIDLAGSERAAATMNMGQRMVEGANINKSLLALGNCINALCESGGAIRHVPYRNSKLTRLLKFSLGGNCKTVMIVCVAPTSNHFDDTHNTLVYAERATKIKTKVVTRNVVNVDRHVGQYVEAINRLNAEILDLKAKISGKRDTEGEIARRKKAEANAEVERAKSDMKLKMEQTRDTIVDGAASKGTMEVANAKLRAIRSRLSQIDAKGSHGCETLPPDLEAERVLLQSLAIPEEQAVKAGSLLNTRLQRGSNSNAMFDATMRAVSERKLEKLDEISVANVKLDAMCRRAEMDRMKAESERDVMRDAVEDMADVMVKLVGMLGRCTVMVGEAADVLGSSENDDASRTSAVARKVAKSLKVVKENNDEVFQKLVGASTRIYGPTSPSTNSSSLDGFEGYRTSFSQRVSSGPPLLERTNTSSYSRRSSSSGANSAASMNSRHPLRSPRRSSRPSMASQPYRRVSDKDKKPVKGTKNVQWRDEAGKGALDDAGPKLSSVVVSVIPPSPDVNNSATSSFSLPEPSLPPRCTSLGGSESEWEDENEKTDDSVNLSLSSDKSLFSSTSSRPYSTKRPRASRLDPSFLKSRTQTSTLGSLVEDDEPASPQKHEHSPLSDVSMNYLGNSLYVAKNRDRIAGSPGKRGPSTPSKNGGTSSGGILKSGGARRRSNIGSMRMEKARRRSSLIPQLSPAAADGSGPRRVVLASPAKRVKRVSLTKSMTVGSLKLRPPPQGPNVSISMMSLDPNASYDLSFNRMNKKATWR